MEAHVLLRVTPDKRIHNFKILESATVGADQEKIVTSKKKLKTRNKKLAYGECP